MAGKAYCVRLKWPILAGVFCLGFSACDSIEPGEPTIIDEQGQYHASTKRERNTIFGDRGLSLLGSEQQLPGGDIGVNSFLWRASLDTISFMPVSSADPFGGVIITDWHANAEAPNERFKLNIYILGRTLRADGIRVALFRQILNQGSQWQDAAVPENAKLKIEDAILTRARQMRNAALVREKK